MSPEEHEEAAHVLLAQAASGLRRAQAQLAFGGGDPVALLRQVWRDVHAALQEAYQVRLDQFDRMLLAEVPKLARAAGQTPTEYMLALLREGDLLTGPQPGATLDSLRPAMRQALAELDGAGPEGMTPAAVSEGA